MIKPIIDVKRKEISQIRPRLGQGRAGLRCKILILNHKPVLQMTENPPKVLAPKSPIIQDKALPIPNYTTPQMKHRGDASS